MSECPHGQEPGIHCPPCDGVVGHRMPSWRLQRRMAARYPGFCHGCHERIDAGERIGLWTDRHDPDAVLVITCALCRPDGRTDVLPELEDPVHGEFPCPACGGRLAFDPRREWRAGRMKTDPKRPPRCVECPYIHARKEHARG